MLYRRHVNFAIGHGVGVHTFMNRAMWQQRIHTLYSEEKRRGQNGQKTLLEEKDTAENRSWRPFQLAFILLNIPALTNLHHPERRCQRGCRSALVPNRRGKDRSLPRPDGVYPCHSPPARYNRRPLG